MQKEIYLYSQESSKNPTYFAVQGDTGRNLKCHFPDIVDLTSEVTEARIWIAKPDGTNVYNNGVINSDGTVTVPVTSQSLAVVGKAKAMVQLTGPDGYITTYEFIIHVLKTVIDEQAAESSDEWGALQEALHEVSAIGRLSDLMTTIKTSIVAAINELVGRINNLFTNQGDLTDLTTAHKDSLVNAINDAAEVPVATANTLGGIMVGNNLSIDNDGVLSAGSGLIASDTPPVDPIDDMLWLDTSPTASIIVNNLTSVDTGKALSAKQGKVLNDKIENNIVTLWENSTPTSDFASQTVTLTDDISNYRFYYIEYKLHKSYATGINATGLIPVSIGTTLMGAKNLLANRDIGLPSGTTIYIADNLTWSSYAGSSSSANNAYNIPVRVMGIK